MSPEQPTPLGVFQKVTQAENSYPAKCIEVSSMEAGVRGSKHTVTMTLSTLKHTLVCKKGPAYHELCEGRFSRCREELSEMPT